MVELNQLYEHQLLNQHLSSHRHSTSNTHLNSIASKNLEPQRKYSQCQPPGHYLEDLGRQKRASESQCSLSASPSAYSYRSRASFASVGPVSASTQPSPSSTHRHHLYANVPSSAASYAKRTNRRMSVDETRQARGTSANNGPVPVKLSLAGIHNFGASPNTFQMDENMQNMQISARSNRQNSKRDFGDSTGDLGLSLQEQLKLTSYQTLMLTQTWPRLKTSVFNGVFRELSQKCPKVKELFQKTSIVGGFSANRCVDMKEHIKELISLYDLSIQDLNAPCKNVQDKCTLIGEVHYAIAGQSSSGIWDDFGVCLTEAISKADAIRGKREAFKAYLQLTSFLVDSMKAGYMAQSKRKSLSRAVNGQAHR
ncbi:hypothetical protein M3Y97_00124300 [Aphelenchoides bicaudatus]|nr:hypothetical protein M3Y97_00124300 [Aphelenchoides bicaudatus]